MRLTPAMPADLRIAIAQPTMYWTGDENTRSVLQAIAQAAALGAQICVFPELAVTGFHRQIAAAAKSDLVAGWLQPIRAACARHSMAAVVGAPTFGDDGCIYNSMLLIDEAGACAGIVEKKGLTDPEATFFARGDARPVVPLQGRRCSTVICREIEDLDDVCTQLQGSAPELIFWPGLMSPEKGKEHIEPPEHVQRAQQLAQRTGAFVIQANWPMSLNHPELSAATGKSVVISPAGKIAFALPQAEAGLAVFTLGQTSYAWTPQ